MPALVAALLRSSPAVLARAVVVAALTLGQAWALPAVSWTATCTQRDEPTLWWALVAPEPPPAPADFACPGTFLDGVDCTRTIGFGKLRATGDVVMGKPVWEVRYLPYGDAPTVLRFLDRDDQGVVFVAKLRPDKPGVPAPIDPDAKRLDRGDLLVRYLTQREKSSAATTGVALHLWTCPEADFTSPDADIEAQGMTVVRHVGRFVLR